MEDQTINLASTVSKKKKTNLNRLKKNVKKLKTNNGTMQPSQMISHTVSINLKDRGVSEIQTSLNAND